MHCDRAKDLLIQSPEPAVGELAEHLRTCSECARFADRREQVRRLLTAHQANVEPDAAFAARVVANLPRRRVDVLGWAALRVLPAACALVVVLAAWSFAVRPDPTILFADALLSDTFLVDAALPINLLETEPLEKRP